ncbi:MAG: Veg family protein [Clostridia bacterium]|nr:Veg family protein [Clostridia bacterium]
MIKNGRDLSAVKKAVEKLKGEMIDVKVNLGRNKFVSYEGVLTSVYSSLFTVSPSREFKGKTSFSYAELMCGNVRIRPHLKSQSNK